jgi:hypothetical protein
MYAGLHKSVIAMHQVPSEAPERCTCKQTHSASVLNKRYPSDVASGPWRAIIDLLTMDAVDWGPRGDSGLGKGPCASFPTCHIFHSQSELGLLLFRTGPVCRRAAARPSLPRLVRRFEPFVQIVFQDCGCAYRVILVLLF